MSSIPPPTLNSYPAGANSPQSSAMLTGQNSAQKLNNLTNIKGGKKIKKRRVQYGGDVIVPVLQPAYAPVSSQNTGSSQIQLATVGNQSGANAAYDKLGPQATVPKQVGGYTGKWGCYSGGRKTKRVGTRKTLTRKYKTRKYKTRKYKTRKYKTRK